ncbi:MAG TPA: tetratricopeptide repeat protein, partial [Chloroflexia bacterium]|nr:tetratricopeptide repeat protein [Chloroflexia bacterium]
SLSRPTPSPAEGPPISRAGRRSSPALLIGGTILALGLFLGLGLGLVLMNPPPTPPSPPPTATVGAATPPASATAGAAPTGAGPAGAGTPTAGPPPRTVDATLAVSNPRQAGDQLLASQQYTQALTLYETALQQNPQDPAALAGRGQALLGLARYQDAANSLTEALAARGTDDPALLLARAQAYLGLQSGALAVQDADRILHQNPTSLPALLVRAQGHALAGDTATATTDYAAAITAHPDAPLAYRQRAAFLLSQNKKADAIADLQKALSLAQLDPSLWVDLGNAAMAYDDTNPRNADQAIDAYNHALQIDPQAAQTYYLRAVAYSSKGDQEHTLADANTAIRLGPATAEMYHLRSDTEGNLGDDPAQIGDLDRAVAVNSNDPTPYWWRMDYYFRHGKYVRASDDLSAVIALKDDLDAYAQRSTLYLLQGEYAKAEQDARHIIAGAPDSAQGPGALAQALFVQGQYKMALDAINQAVAHGDQYTKPDALAGRGRIYLRLNELPQAEADLKAALALYKDDALALQGLAELAVARQQPDTALGYLQQWEGDNHGWGGGYLVRATIEAGRGDTEKARADLAEARQRALFPDEVKAADALAQRLKPAP